MKKPGIGRSKISNGDNFIEIEISVKRKLLMILFGAYLIFAGITSLSMPGLSFISLFKNALNVFLWPLILVSILGLILAFLGLGILVWSFWGKERIRMDRNGWKLERKLYFFSRSQVYDSNQIRHFRILPISNHPFFSLISIISLFNIRQCGTMAFDYGLETIRFGIELEDVEAGYIFEILKGNEFINPESFVNP